MKILARQLLLSFLLILFGCQGYNVKVLTINLGGMPTLNIHNVTDEPTARIVCSIYEGLYRNGKSGELIPALCRNLEIVDNTYTFTLREAYWTNGDPVTAHDFLRAWVSALGEEQVTDRQLLYPIRGAVERSDIAIFAEADDKLVVTLKEKNEFFLESLTNPIFFPLHYQEGVTNGPYFLESQSDTEFVLKKSETYWNAKNISIERINFKILDNTQALTLFEKGKLDLTDLSSDQLEHFKKTPEKVTTIGDGVTEFILFNKNNNIMSNTNIRKALSSAIDRDTIITNVLKTMHQPALTFVNPSINGSLASLAAAEKSLIDDDNIALSKELLKLGLSELGLDTLPKITLFTRTDSPLLIEYSNILKSVWLEGLGIDVDIIDTRSPGQELYRTRKEMAMLTFRVTYNSPLCFLDYFTDENVYDNQEFRDLLVSARAEAPNNPASAIDMYTRAETMLLTDCIVSPLFHNRYAFVASKKAENILRAHSLEQNLDLYWH